MRVKGTFFIHYEHLMKREERRAKERRDRRCNKRAQIPRIFGGTQIKKISTFIIVSTIWI